MLTRLTEQQPKHNRQYQNTIINYGHSQSLKVKDQKKAKHTVLMGKAIKMGRT
jgi:hypothetical protein